MSVKCSLYCPPEGTAPGVNLANAQFPVVPVVGDVLNVPQLSPAAGCGSGFYRYRVVEREVGARGVHLTLTRVRDER